MRAAAQHKSRMQFLNMTHAQMKLSVSNNWKSMLRIVGVGTEISELPKLHRHGRNFRRNEEACAGGCEVAIVTRQSQASLGALPFPECFESCRLSTRCISVSWSFRTLSLKVHGCRFHSDGSNMNNAAFIKALQTDCTREANQRLC